MNWLTQNWLWILVGIGSLLLLRRTGCFGSMNHAHSGHTRDNGNHGEHSQRSTYTATDPVTGKNVAMASALASVYHEQIYYFESPKSRQRFETSPDGYTHNRDGRSTTQQESGEHRGAHRHGGCC